MTDPAPYCTYDEAVERVESLRDFAEAMVTDCIAEFEPIAERYRGVPFVPREFTETILTRPLTGTLRLSWPMVTDVDTITADDVDLDLSYITILGRPGILRDVPWPGSVREAVATYTAGFATVPPILKRGCIEYVNRTLKAEASGTSRDVRSQGFDGGTTSYVTPDWDHGRPTGFLEVDRILNSLEDFRLGSFA